MDTPKNTGNYAFLNSRRLLTVIDSQHRALFCLQQPDRAHVYYRRQGQSVVACHPQHTIELCAANSPENAQFILGTLLRGLVSRAHWRKITLLMSMFIILLLLMTLPASALPSFSPSLSLCLLLYAGVNTLLLCLKHIDKSRRLNRLKHPE